MHVRAGSKSEIMEKNKPSGRKRISKTIQGCYYRGKLPHKNRIAIEDYASDTFKSLMTGINSERFLNQSLLDPMRPSPAAEFKKNMESADLSHLKP
jgi:hypothetical protein